MQKHFVIYQSSTIHYHVFGEGKKMLFCFHGYGEDGSSFSFLEAVLGNDYTLIAPELPFHGDTEWNEGLPFTPQDLINILHLICSNFSYYPKFSLLGYSMGGRVCMNLPELIPQQIESVVLIAPDGLHKNFWYRLATKTVFGNKIFQHTMYHPQWLFVMMNAAHKMGLLADSMYRLAHHYLDNAGERQLLYKRWTTMRKFEINLPQLKKAILKEKIPVRLLFGSSDKIIVSSKANRLRSGLEDFVNIKNIDAGHRLLKEKHAAVIASMFYE